MKKRKSRTSTGLSVTLKIMTMIVMITNKTNLMRRTMMTIGEGRGTELTCTTYTTEDCRVRKRDVEHEYTHDLWTGRLRRERGKTAHRPPRCSPPKLRHAGK